MQPLRYLCISAHEDGSVNYAEIGWGSDGESDRLVLPLPLYTEIMVDDLLDALVRGGRKYWVSSYAALCGILMVNDEEFEDLWVKVMEKNELDHHTMGTRPLPFDQETF